MTVFDCLVYLCVPGPLQSGPCIPRVSCNCVLCGAALCHVAADFVNPVHSVFQAICVCGCLWMGNFALPSAARGGMFGVTQLQDGHLAPCVTTALAASTHKPTMLCLVAGGAAVASVLAGSGAVMGPQCTC
jgi:hypothetical protein